MPSARQTDEAQRAFARYREDGDPAAITRVFDLTAPTLLTLASHLVRDRNGREAVSDFAVDATSEGRRFSIHLPGQ